MIGNLRLFLLASWLGAAFFFSAVVAPSAFSVVRGFQVSNSSEIAGEIVNRTLSIVNTSGVIVSLILLFTVLTVRKLYGRRWFSVELVSMAVMAVAAGVGQWVIAARLHALRAGLALPIDQIPFDDARRIAFNSLHRYSVAALSIAMIAALLSIVLKLYFSNK